VAVVERLFYAFKLLQAGVFLAWCVAHDPLVSPVEPLAARALGLALIVTGQVLSVGVFYRLGRVGAFFGDRLGCPTRWCEGFPFSLAAHPQYVGAVLTIWGVFLLLRFPADDWFRIPLLETVYYWAGAVLEGRPPRPAEMPERSTRCT
jgi:methylene-fatty-acyl-phospholipid synthase